jgi:hypothetical protein
MTFAFRVAKNMVRSTELGSCDGMDDNGNTCCYKPTKGYPTCQMKTYYASKLMAEKQGRLLNRSSVLPQTTLRENIITANPSTKFVAQNMSKIMRKTINPLISEPHINQMMSNPVISNMGANVLGLIQTNDILSGMIGNTLLSTAPAMLSNFVLPVIGSIAMHMVTSFMMEMFSDNQEDETLKHVMNEIREGFRILGQQLNQIRQEMHEGFGNIKKQISDVSRILDMGIYNITLDIDRVQSSVARSEHVMTTRFDILDKNLLVSEHLIGTSIGDMSWRIINDAIKNYADHRIRFGKHMGYTELVGIARIIENTIRNPPMLNWINGKFLLEKEHTPDLDTRYFRNKSFGSMIGWFTGKLLMDPFLVKTLFDVYVQIRHNIRNINRTYDQNGSMLNMIGQIIMTHKQITVSGSTHTTKKEQIVGAFNQIDNVIKKHKQKNNSDLIYADPLRDEQIMVPFRRTHTELYGGFYNKSDCYDWDCRICNGDYPYTNRIQRWIMWEIRDRAREFAEQSVIAGSIIVYPIKDAMKLTGMYDIPMVFNNHWLNRMLGSVTYKLFRVCEAHGFGKLSFEYKTTFIPTDHMIVRESDCVPGSMFPDFETSANPGDNWENGGWPVYAENVVGKSLHYNFTIIVSWIPHGSVQKITISEITSRSHDSVPFTFDKQIIDRYDEKYARIQADHREGKQIPAAYTFSFIHSNCGYLMPHPWWNYHYVEKAIQTYGFSVPIHTPDYQRLTSDMIRRANATNLTIVRNICEDTTQSFNQIRGCLRWIATANQVAGMDQAPLTTHINTIDNVIQLFDNTWNTAIMEQQYITYKQQVLGTITVPCTDLMITDTYLTMAYDSIDVIHQLNYDTDSTDETEKSLEIENTQLKDEIHAMHEKLNLLLSTIGQKEQSGESFN